MLFPQLDWYVHRYREINWQIHDSTFGLTLPHLDSYFLLLSLTFSYFLLLSLTTFGHTYSHLLTLPHLYLQLLVIIRHCPPVALLRHLQINKLEQTQNETIPWPSYFHPTWDESARSEETAGGEMIQRVVLYLVFRQCTRCACARAETGGEHSALPRLRKIIFLSHAGILELTWLLIDPL